MGLAVVGQRMLLRCFITTQSLLVEALEGVLLVQTERRLAAVPMPSRDAPYNAA